MSEVPVADRLEIQELVARYSFRADTRDFVSVPELFAADGVWDETVLGAPLCEGRAAIDAAFAALAATPIDSVVHINGCHQITAFGGDRAGGTSHLHAELAIAGASIRILGYYDDEYVKVDGHWRFARRRLVELAPTTGLPADAVITAADGDGQ